MDKSTSTVILIVGGLAALLILVQTMKPAPVVAPVPAAKPASDLNSLGQLAGLGTALVGIL
jgi:hypothetical protein